MKDKLVVAFVKVCMCAALVACCYAVVGGAVKVWGTPLVIEIRYTGDPIAVPSFGVSAHLAEIHTTTIEPLEDPGEE